jgi:hypothetical protein
MNKKSSNYPKGNNLPGAFGIGGFIPLSKRSYDEKEETGFEKILRTDFEDLPLLVGSLHEGNSEALQDKLTNKVGKGEAVINSSDGERKIKVVLVDDEEKIDRIKGRQSK